MKRLFIYIGISLIGGCGRAESPRLQTGDLLFQAGKTSEMSRAIHDATGRKASLDYTHVGIALRTAGADSVLEATGEGVRIVALRRFLDEAGRIDGRPAVVAMRLRDTAGVAASVARARQAVGLPYDWSFRPDNGRFYCSELVWEYYLTPEGRRIFEARPMNFRSADGSMPGFWTELFERLGEPIPEGVPGTNPNDMAREPILEETGRFF
ncbi:YiiX/YebB-like N1pC/P60 family cysteine hydrolase [uncultured Alistipes sp.]|uniref:YiiX/YebB-like N1pC/P60 family cysteine hydrolase n=1 Tax=uncultured Alistipes sp. TaxID=538949 RepID=UPI00261C3BFC|nr:YiiX/YebB-like N1pC/P60 family cysteine hydrolase [uncultured Alistipes sp.]